MESLVNMDDFSLIRGIRRIERSIAPNFRLQGDKLMKIKVFWAMLLSLTCLAIPVTGTAQAVAIPDANLRAAIESTLGKASGDPISQDELGELASLNASGANVSDLTGLEGATNLTSLVLADNSVSDISALAGLTNLT
jgi:Leucine-rich repeat (LRR) protein